MFIFLLTYLFSYVLGTVNVVDKGIAPLEKDSVGMQFYMDVENDNRNGDCVVHSWTKKCCLTPPGADEDCGVMRVFSPYNNVIKPKDRKTLIHVYPSLVQHDLVGYCDFVLNHNCDNNKFFRREVVNIPFDTRVSSGAPDLIQNYVEDKNTAECENLDEDSLNRCEPVNCAYKYAEALSYYDNTKNKCVKTEQCISSRKKELPDVAYVPISNTCRDLDKPLTLEDVVAISKRMTVITGEPLQMTQLKLELKSNCSTISENIFLLKDLILGRLTPVLKVDMSDYKRCLIKATLRVLAGMVLVCISLLVFMLILFIVSYIHNKRQKRTLFETYTALTQRFKRSSGVDHITGFKVSRVNAKVRNSLLKDVIVRDIPMELRDSVVDICERMERDVKWKRRYRKQDLGSQLSLEKTGDMSTTDTSTNTDEENERAKLLKPT